MISKFTAAAFSTLLFSSVAALNHRHNQETLSTPLSIDELVAETQWRVRETYGENSDEWQFLNMFANDMLPQTDSTEDAGTLLADGLTALKQSYDTSATQLFEDHATIQRFAQKTGVLSIGKDTPCSTQEACDKLSKAMNACNTARSLADNVYGSYLTATNVMNIMISVLCACIFIGPAHVCALRNFPYTCTFPYQVFGTFMQGSSSVFEVQKSLSSLCRMSTDPNIIPKIG